MNWDYLFRRDQKKFPIYLGSPSEDGELISSVSVAGMLKRWGKMVLKWSFKGIHLNLSFHLLKNAWPRFQLPVFSSPCMITSVMAFNSPSITQLLLLWASLRTSIPPASLSWRKTGDLSSEGEQRWWVINWIWLLMQLLLGVLLGQFLLQHWFWFRLVACLPCLVHAC